MTTRQDQLFKAARQAIEEATDTLHFEGGQSVTALECWQIERLYRTCAAFCLRWMRPLMRQAQPSRFRLAPLFPLVRFSPHRARRRRLPLGSFASTRTGTKAAIGA
jgi:hypothetical protein